MKSSGFQHGQVAVDGCDLHYVRGGAGPVLIFLHGWPATWWSWRDVLPELATEYTVVAFDLPGLGESGIPADGYDAASAARRLHQAVTALRLGPVGIVAHDLGAQIAYPYTREFPADVTRMIVSEALLNGFGLEDCYAYSFHFGLNAAARPVPENIINDETYRAYHGWLFSEGTIVKGRVDTTEFLRAYSDAARRSAGYDYYRAFEENAVYNTKHASERLTLPVLALSGAEGVGADVALSFQGVADDVRSVVVPDVAHWIPEEDPAFMVDCVRQFFGGR
ncbi:MAG TPA: alpha/beta hydrolase [Pseudonocardiaceae bacterium]|nr:alpha/beta hydrolase [Pseudonocardiaceae bacterium]